MKTIFKLLVAALVVNASFRAGQAAFRHYQFKDAVEQEARFTPKATTSELQQRVVELAEEYEIALDPQDVDIQRNGDETVVSAAYFQSVELVPRFYTREQLFEFEVSVRAVRPLTVDDLK